MVIKKTITLVSFFTIFFICFPAYPVSEPSVIIDSITGKAEVKRAGQEKWLLIGKKGILYNNDVIRVLNQSMIRLMWQNGNVIYVNANSQLLINLHEDTVNNKFLNYVTVFFGAVFFVIKETLPTAFTNRFETKVYTPTASVAIRGTSFSVNVKKQNGLTQVGILNGTVLVNNILKNQLLFLSAGYQTEIALNTDPMEPSPLLDKHIAQLKTWVPPEVVLNEMKQQIKRAKNDYATIAGKLENKIIILPFANSSSYRGSWEITDKIARFLNDRLKLSHNSPCSLVIDTSSASDPVTKGIQHKARFVITGEIRKFDIIQKVLVTANADKYDELAVASICVNLQLIDCATKTIIYNNNICEEINGRNVSGNNWQYIAKLPFDLKDQTFSSSILGKALNQLLDQSTAQLTRYMIME